MDKDEKEYQEYTVRSSKPGLKQSKGSSAHNKLFIVAGLLAVVAILGFVSGMQFQQHRGGKTTQTASGMQTGQNGQIGENGFGGGRMRNGGFGSVTAISATSITVKSDRTDTTKTYSISDSTQITANQATATYSDIAVGDTVIVTTSSSTSTAATRIVVNPSMGSGPGGASGSTNTDGSSTDTGDTSGQTTQTN